MDFKETKKVLDWLEQNFENQFECYVNNSEKNHTKIEVSIFSEDENVWITKNMFFDNQGIFMPNYEKEKEIKEEIKKLQEELKKLQKSIDK